VLVELLQQMRHALDVVALALEGGVAEHADLPQDHVARRIDHPAVDQEIGRLIGLAAGHRGVEIEVGEHAVLGRHARQHAGLEAFGARAPHRFMRRIGEDAGMAIGREAYALAFAHIAQRAVDHLVVGLDARLVLAVEVMEGFRAVRIQGLDHLFGDRIADDIERLVGALDPGDRLHGHLADGADAGADDDQLLVEHQCPPACGFCGITAK